MVTTLIPPLTTLMGTTHAWGNPATYGLNRPQTLTKNATDTTLVVGVYKRPFRASCSVNTTRHVARRPLNSFRVPLQVAAKSITQYDLRNVSRQSHDARYPPVSTKA
jgi:hypothetical protein